MQKNRASRNFARLERGCTQAMEKKRKEQKEELARITPISIVRIISTKRTTRAFRIFVKWRRLERVRAPLSLNAHSARMPRQ